MKCNKIKIILYIYQSLTVILYNTYTKMSIDSCQTEGQQCIAFPHREKKRAKKRLTLRRSERSQIKGRREDRGGGAEADGFFALVGLVWFHFLKTAQSSMKEAIFRKQNKGMEYLPNTVYSWNPRGTTVQCPHSKAIVLTLCSVSMVQDKSLQLLSFQNVRQLI